MAIFPPQASKKRNHHIRRRDYRQVAHISLWKLWNKPEVCWQASGGGEAFSWIFQSFSIPLEIAEFRLEPIQSLNSVILAFAILQSILCCVPVFSQVSVILHTMFAFAESSRLFIFWEKMWALIWPLETVPFCRALSYWETVWQINVFALVWTQGRRKCVILT